jgi:DNA-binding HxlR family transcriptional regulator
MSETIKVDEDILNDQIRRLQELVEDGALRKHVEQQSVGPARGTPTTPGRGRSVGVVSFNESAGRNVIELLNLQKELETAVTALYTLANHTLTLLTEGQASFIETDKYLAERIRIDNL